MALQRLVAGIDLGTQGLKVILYDPEERRIVAQSKSPLELVSRDDGSREQLASWWLTALGQCFDELPLNYRKNIVALAVSGQQHGFVPIGADGEVLAPVKLWNDTSTVEECELIHKALGGAERAIEVAGNPILVGYTASKVLRLKLCKPEKYQELRQILLPHDFLNYYLTGRYVAECGDASGTGFFDIRKKCWSDEVLRAIDSERNLRELLPPILSPHESVGRVLPRVAEKLGIPSETLVAVGGGDNMMGAIGTGTVLPGALTISLGTSGTLYGYSDQPAISETQEFAAFCSSTGGYLPLVCSLNCTAATELMREMLKISLEDLDTLISQSTPGAAGITALPFFNGERTPYSPHGKGCFFGLTPSNANQSHLIRSVVEATVFSFKTGLEAMQRRGLVAKTARVIGGGSHSREWLQLIADILNIEVMTPLVDEAAAFGAALQALWCSELKSGRRITMPDLVAQHLIDRGQNKILPRSDVAKTYLDAYRRYQQHVEIMREYFV